MVLSALKVLVEQSTLNTAGQRNRVAGKPNIVIFVEKLIPFFFFFPQNLKDQILTTNIWLEHEWQDHKFKWDPAEYGGVTELYVPSEHIWLPDIVLYNK